MPNIRDKSTVDAIARAFTGNCKRNKTRAMIEVGYDAVYADCGRGQKSVYGNIRVIEAIRAIDTKTQKKLDLSRESQHNKLKEAFDIAKTAKNASAMTSAIREQNEMLGYHREKGLNPEKEAARAKRMTKEQRHIAEKWAKERTNELAERGRETA